VDSHCADRSRLIRDLRRAGYVERRTSGSGSGQGKPTGGNTGRASLADFHHNFLNLPGSVGDMLAEARGYHFGMVLAHQNLAQMPRDTQLAISANARNKIYFSCAPEDAHQLARHTMPELDEHDLSHMDAFRAACRLVVEGRETAAFTLHTNPPRPLVGEATAVRQAAAAAVAGKGGNRSAIAKTAGVDNPPDLDQAQQDPPDNPTDNDHDTE
jgi:hypothetical protein